MKQAVVTGATGHIGSAVVRELLNNGIEVLAIGRRPLKQAQQASLPAHEALSYLQLNLADISELPELVQGIDWKMGDQCVFYHFAWSGLNRLTDGEIEDQIKNVSYAADAVVAAKALGCVRFVNAGTLEETFLEKRLQSDWLKENHNSQQEFYAVSKLSSRDMCRLIAYLKKIEYVHTRISTFVDETLVGGSYISSVFRGIIKGEAYEKPKNEQLFDLLPLSEGARAYRLIGEHGVNKADYFIGSGDPQTLEEYFARFEALVRGVPYSGEVSASRSEGLLKVEDYSSAALEKDTGFRLRSSFVESLGNVLSQ